MGTIGFIGGGNMAEAIIRGIVSAEVFEPENVLVSDIRPERLDDLRNRYGIESSEDNAEVAQKSDIVVLSVKPKILAEAMESIKGKLRDGALVISIVAGKRVADITKVLGDVGIVRVMPNTPALVAEGASALYANEMGKTALDDVKRIFLCIGRAIVVEDESLIDAVTAVSGSGPAYYFLLMQEMIKVGVELGLSEEVSRGLVLQTAKGAAMLAEAADRDGESPADLSAKVATPGGTTEAALNVFYAKGFPGMVSEALQAAERRSRELSG